MRRCFQIEMLHAFKNNHNVNFDDGTQVVFHVLAKKTCLILNYSWGDVYKFHTSVYHQVEPLGGPGSRHVLKV